MTPAERPRRRAVVAVALASLSLLAGCTSGRADTTDPTPTAVTSSSTPEGPASPRAYVALGDSYTAAPFVPVTDVAGVFAGMIVLAIFVVLIDTLVTWVERRLLVWRPPAGREVR